MFNETGCAGINIGDRDLAGGRALLTALAGRAKFPFLSANLLDPASKKPIFTPHRVVEVAGTKIGLLGLLTQRARLAATTPPEFEVGDPVEAARASVAALNAEGATLIVLLSQLTPDEAKAVLEAAPDIDLVLGSQQARRVTHLETVAERLQAVSHNRGKHIGVVVLHVQPESKALVLREASTAIAQEIASIDSRIRRYESQWKRALAGPNASAERTAYYPRSIDRLVKQRAALAATVGDLKPVDASASFASFDLVPLSRALTPNEAIEALVTTWKAAHPEPKKSSAGLGAASRTRRGGPLGRAAPTGAAVKKGALRAPTVRPVPALKPTTTGGTR